MFILGIDPGINGALAICSGVHVDYVANMPTLSFTKGKTVKTRLDLGTLYDILLGLHAAFDVDLAVIEEVGGLPKQSAPHAFTFGYTTGATAMAVVAAGIPLVRVPPQVWKKALRVPADKDAAVAVANELLPQSRHHWPRKKDDGRAEAALLAYYGFHHHRSYHSAAVAAPLSD